MALGGYNNAYDVKLKTKLAAVSAECAVLEHYHVATLFKTLENSSVKLLSKVGNANVEEKKMIYRKEQKEFKDIMISGILATDMANHGKHFEKFSARVKATQEVRELLKNNQTPSTLLVDKAYRADRFHDRKVPKFTLNNYKQVIQNLIHACDIGVLAASFENFINLASLVHQEFDYQVPCVDIIQ
jgi:3-phosphoglycerate kinase